MTSIIEKTVAILAPYRCIMCGDYDNIVCVSCIKTLPNFTHSICLLCGAANHDWQPCDVCKPSANISGLYAYAAYDDKLERLIKEFKFNFARAAAEPLSSLLDRCVPHDSDWYIVHIPTASPRIRWRGYDQAKLLAKAFAKRRKLPMFGGVLVRRHSLRQVGASRQERHEQAESLFLVSQPELVKGKKILLIDDVCTTGATFSAAAKALTKAGAVQVSAAAVAWQPKNTN